MEPHNPEELYTISPRSHGISTERERNVMGFAAQPRVGVHFGAKYAWDARVENIRQGEAESVEQRPLRARDLALG